MNEQTVFVTALERDPAERQAFLESACADDPDLRKRVEKLLVAHENAVQFMDLPDDAMAATLVRPASEIPGTQIGPYKLLQRIGEGGMGVVYMAEQKEPVERRVALKVIKPGMDTGQVIARFEAERQALAMMDHPNIAKVLDAGATDSERPFFVMELVNGIPIVAYCDQEHLTTRERLELFAPICQAVQHAHQKGIIHRDLKPSNILIALYDGRPVPKVIDFGVAKATAQRLTEKTLFTGLGQIVGTLEYMSPEQAQRNQLDIDTRSDVYSLGVVLYEVLTGTTPFERKRLRGAAYDEILRIIREEEPPRPSARLSTVDTLPSIAANRRIEPQKLSRLLRGELDWIVMKALEKDRARRYETANGFAADIQRYLDDEAVVACPPSATYRFRKFARRNKAALATTAMLTLALLLGLIGTSWQAWRATLAERETGLERDRALSAEQNEREKSRELEEQLHVSTATRLAAQSELTRPDPIKSTLLAVEAVEATRRYEEPIVPVAHEALLKSAAVLGGEPLRHQHYVWEAEISPDSRWLITGGGDYWREVGEARLWDLTAENPAASSLLLSGHEHFVFSVAINNRWAVTGGADNTVRLWDLTASDPAASPRVLRGHQAAVDNAAVSPNGRWLVTENFDETVLWDLAARDPGLAPMVLRHEQRSSLGSPLISPDSRWMVTRVQDNRESPSQPLLCDLTRDDPTSSPIRLEGHEQEHRQRTVIGPNSRWLVTEYGQTARLWDLNALAQDLLAEPIILDVQDRIGSLAFTPDGRRLAIGTEKGVVQIWDLVPDTPPSLAVKLSGGLQGRVDHVTISGNGRWLASAGDDDTAALWDLHAEDLVSSLSVLRGHTGSIRQIAISRDNHWLVTSSSDRTDRAWDLIAERPAASSVVLRGHDGATRGTTISPDSRWLVTVGGQLSTSNARLWRLNPRPVASPLELAGHAATMTYAVHSWDSRWLVTASADTTVRVWDLFSNNPAATVQVLPDHEDSVRHLTMSRDDRWLVTASDDTTARVWDFRAGNPVLLHMLPHDSGVRDVAISPDNRWVLTTTSDKNFLWDLTHNEPESSAIEVPGSYGGSINPFSLVFSPDSRWLVTRRPTGSVWDLNAPHLFESPTISFATNSESDSPIAISSDSRWLASKGDEQTTAQLWDLKSDDPASSEIELPGHTKAVTGVVISSNNHWLFTTSNDKTVRRWDLTAETPATSSFVLHDGTEGVVIVSISQDGRWLATASANAGPFWVRLWDLAEASPSAIVLAGSKFVVFSTDSRWLWAPSTDGTQRLFDLWADDPAKSSRGVPAQDRFGFSPDCRWLSSSLGATVRVWDFQVDSQMSRSRHLAGRELTQDEREQYQLPAEPVPGAARRP